ncbi:GntR family transcriptional regulator, partial [bacterium]
MKKYSNLTLKVYHRIIELMLNYEIVPGQRLVFIDLAKQLGVSRTPVNNALSILAQEGYLDFVPNQGYSVHKLTRKEAENLYEFREVLEVGFLGFPVNFADFVFIGMNFILIHLQQHQSSGEGHLADI